MTSGNELWLGPLCAHQSYNPTKNTNKMNEKKNENEKKNGSTEYGKQWTGSLVVQLPVRLFIWRVWIRSVCSCVCVSATPTAFAQYFIAYIDLHLFYRRSIDWFIWINSFGFVYVPVPASMSVHVQSNCLFLIIYEPGHHHRCWISRHGHGHRINYVQLIKAENKWWENKHAQKLWCCQANNTAYNVLIVTNLLQIRNWI